MKVLVIHNRYASGIPSGENTVVDQELKLLRDSGAQVVDYQRSSDEISTWSPARQLTLPIQPTRSRQAIHEVRGILDEFRPDIVHLHNVFPLISPAVIRLIKAFDVPVVQTVHNFRHVCSSGIYFRDGKECKDCFGRRVPTPAIIHGCYRNSRLQSLAMATALTIHRSTWHEVDCFIALTPLIAEHLQEAGFRSERIRVKPNSAPDPGEPVPLGSGFFFAGRLSEEKGISLLLNAWASCPDGGLGHLTIAGDGPLQGEVKQAAAQRRDITYVGPIDRARVRTLMRASAVTVVPSVCAEVCPIVAIESLANGRPVLSTSQGGLPFLVGRSGGWTVGTTVNEFAAGLRQAAGATEEHSQRARNRYESRFSPSTVTKELLEIYRQVAGL